MKKRNIFVFLIMLIINSVFMLNREVSNLDELWNYNFARNICDGLLPYKDFSIIITPLYPAIVAIFLKLIANQLIVSRVIGVILFTCIVYLAYKILDYLVENKWVTTMVILSIMIVFASEFWGDYNFAILFFVLLIMYLELKNNKGRVLFLNPRYDFWMGILVGLAIITKQTTGGILAFTFIIYKWLTIKNKQDIILAFKISFIRAVGVLVPVIVFTGYLLITNSFSDFIDYTIMGISTFNNSFPYQELLTHPDIELIYKIIGGLIPIFIIVGTVIWFKTKNEELLVILIFSLQNMAVVYPLFDVGHSLIASLPLFITFIYAIYLVVGKYLNKKANIILIPITIILASSLIVTCGISGVNYIQNSNNDLKHLYGTPMNENLHKHIKELSSYINEKEKSGEEVYIVTIDAVLPMIVADRYHKNYDMLTKGNLGSKGEVGLIEDMNKKESSLFMIREEKSRNRQSTDFAIDYIKNNYRKIGDYLGFGIYTH